MRCARSLTRICIESSDVPRWRRPRLLAALRAGRIRLPRRVGLRPAPLAQRRERARGRLQYDELDHQGVAHIEDECRSEALYCIAESN